MKYTREQPEARLIELKHLRKQGFEITPVDDVKKKPVCNEKTNYKWSNNEEFGYQWSDEELLEYKAWGIYHNKNKDTKFAAIDFDDKHNVIQRYASLFPWTMQVMKNTKNGKSKTAQLIYKVNGQGFPKFDYGGASKEDGKLVETLQSGISRITGKDRWIWNTHEITEAEPEHITKCLKLACFFSEVEKKFPPKGLGKRDEAHLRLAGALARLDEIAYPTMLLEQFHTRLCENIDDNEISNRVNKIAYQRRQLKGGQEVFGIKELANSLNANFKSYDLLKTNVEETEKPLKEYPLIDFGQMLNIDYPVPKFILDPIIREKTVTQISGDYGSGKTHVGLKLALDISQGLSFHVDQSQRKGLVGYDWYRHNDKIKPTLYVEGELPAVDVRDRVNTLVQPFIESETKFDINLNNMYFLTLDDLEMNGFKYGFEPLAITNAEDKAKLNRKLIDNMLDKIKDKTGQYPVLFLDNVTALTSIDENKSTDWSGFMMWLMLLKTKGVIIVFFHHTGKTNGTASGSNLSQRLVDTHIILKKLPEKAKFENHDGVQCSVHYDKFRNFGGRRTLPFMLLCDKQGQWTKYNMIMDKKDFKILELYNEGKTVKQMCSVDPELKEATVYRRIEKMKQEGIILGGKDDDGFQDI